MICGLVLGLKHNPSRLGKKSFRGGSSSRKNVHLYQGIIETKEWGKQKIMNAECKKQAGLVCCVGKREGVALGQW